MTSYSSIEHVYSNGGMYDVKVMVINSCSGDTASASITIAVDSSEAIVDFYAPAFGCVNVPVTIINNTTGVFDSLVWSFCDGTTLVQYSPDTVVHIYTDPGLYKIEVQAPATGTCSSYSYKWITIIPEIYPVAEFSWSSSGLTVYFTNLSSGATEFLWYFGDGNISTEHSPVHTYPSPGTYTVTLIAGNPCGYSDTIRHTITLVGTAINMFSGNKPAIFPVPANGFIWIRFEADEYVNYSVRLLTMDGRTVIFREVSGSESIHRLYLGDIAPGTYILEILRNKQVIYRDLLPVVR